MRFNTQENKTYLLLFLSNKLSGSIFSKIEISPGGGFFDLCKTIQNIIINKNDINAENIFMISKSNEQVADYMKICNDIDYIKNDKRDEFYEELGD